MTWTPDDADLHALVDGRLPPDRRDAVLAWLRAHPDVQARVDAWQRDAHLLRADWAGLDAPTALPPAIGVAAARRRLVRRRRARAGLATACALALGIGTLFGWQLRGAGVGDRAPMADAVAAYRLFATGPAPLEFDAGRRTQLQAWLHAQFGAAGDVPDFSAQGYRLEGGRLLSTPEGAAAMLVYQDRDGGRIGLYLRPRTPRLAAPGERRDGRLLAQYWAEGRTAFALVGPATQVRLRALAPLLRGAG